MRKWTTSACVALAWSIIMPLLAAAGLAAPAQATTTTSITLTTLAKAPGMPYPTNPNATAVLASESATANTATAEDTQADTQADIREAASPAGKPAATWTVRQGDTLSGIAAALSTPGGWQALYAANRQAIGPNPNAIRPGTMLALPRSQAPVRYTVRPGDTLFSIAAALTMPGGWQALYAANRQAIGPNPNAIRPGTALTAYGEPHRPARHPANQPANHNQHQAAPPAQTDNAKPSSQPTAVPSHLRSHPQIAPDPAASTMPNWLKDILLAAGLLAAIAFAIEPVAALARRRRLTDKRPTDKAPRSHANTRERDPARDATGRARIIFADHERLIITYSAKEDTVYVLTPSGEDPKAILRAARLILPEHRYQDLADHLGVPSALPLE